LETKDLTTEELIKFISDNRNKSHYTRVNWYCPAEPKLIEIFFLDSEYKPFESVKLERNDYKNLIKPALQAIT